MELYAVSKATYPKESERIEEIKYFDRNDFEWRIARTTKGFYLAYLGDAYFADDTFQCHTRNNKIITIKNTKCIYFITNKLDDFCIIRDLIKDSFTDDIWDGIEEMFTFRFDFDETLISSEKV